jgi:hypothetical protein
MLIYGFEWQQKGKSATSLRSLKNREIVGMQAEGGTMVNLQGLSLSGVMAIALVSLVSIFLLIGFIVYILYKTKTIHIKFEALDIAEIIKLMFTIGSFITVIITIAFLIAQQRFLLFQTECTIKTSQGNVLGFITNNSLAVDKLFITNPEMRPYFYYNKPIEKDDKLYEQACATAEYLLDYFDSLLLHLNLSPYLEDYYRKSWEATIIDSFLWSPILRSYLEENRTWFSPELYALYAKARQRKSPPEK